MARFSPTSREEVYDFLDDYARGDRHPDEENGFGGGLITSYLLEYHTHGEPEGVRDLLASEEWDLEDVDGTIYRVSDGEKPLGFAESVSSRYLLVHSARPTHEADTSVMRRVRDSVALDCAWLPGSYLERLWLDWILPANPDRVAHLKFDHVARFDLRTDLWEESSDEERESSDEHRHYVSSVSEIRDRGVRLAEVLPALQMVHSPFRAIQMVRVPSHQARGAFDLWGWGKMTYRSPDFRRGRGYMEAFAEFYGRVVAAIEKRLWFSVENDSGLAYGIEGAPLTLTFDPPLEGDVFEALIDTTFVRGVGPLRLWGNPIRVGERRVHVYGIDKHLWHRMHMELTPGGLTVVLPKGTCGNTVNRLIANVQRYVHPGVRAWVGDTSYSELVSDCLGGTEPDPFESPIVDIPSR